MRGWKLFLHGVGSALQLVAGHSAPTMRGWKLSSKGLSGEYPGCRTLSPDNEGMETDLLCAALKVLVVCRTLSPDNEGMETGFLFGNPVLIS